MATNTGGQAFPRAGFGFAYRDEGTEYECSREGMTLRDYFAGQALATFRRATMPPDELARWVYSIADAMIAERDRGA